MSVESTNNRKRILKLVLLAAASGTLGIIYFVLAAVGGTTGYVATAVACLAAGTGFGFRAALAAARN